MERGKGRPQWRRQTVMGARVAWSSPAGLVTIGASAAAVAVPRAMEAQTFTHLTASQ